jgi:sugar (pentulose or hexulose) kinase
VSETQTLTLSVDCGSTNLKAAVFDDQFERLTEASVPVEYSVDDGVNVEFCAASAVAGWRSLLDSVLRPLSSWEGMIGCVAITSQAQTFTLIDPSGEAITPFYSWMDRRAEKEAAEIGAALGGEFHEHCSFSSPVPQLQSAKVLWADRHMRGGLPADARLVSLPAFFAMDLGLPNITDSNLAAMGGLYSLGEGGWWKEALVLCGLRRDQLPDVVAVGQRVRIAGAPKHLDPECDVVFAGNDQTSGAFGNGCHRGGMVVTLGTALVVYRYAGEEPGPYHTEACWGPYPGGGYYELSTRDGGCRALDWAREKLMPRRSAAEFDRAADRALGDDGVPGHDWCFFYPQRLDAETSWQGEGTSGERAHAVLEGIGFLLRHLIETELKADRSPSEITVTGGGSHSAVWVRMLADILGCPVRPGAGDSLLGSALMCGGRPESEVGRSTISVADAALPQSERKAAYEQRYKMWVNGLPGGEV